VTGVGKKNCSLAQLPHQKEPRHCEPVRTLAWQSPSGFRELSPEEIHSFSWNCAIFSTTIGAASPHGIATSPPLGRLLAMTYKTVNYNLSPEMKYRPVGTQAGGRIYFSISSKVWRMVSTRPSAKGLSSPTEFRNARKKLSVLYRLSWYSARPAPGSASSI